MRFTTQDGLVRIKIGTRFNEKGWQRLAEGLLSNPSSPDYTDLFCVLKAIKEDMKTFPNREAIDEQVLDMEYLQDQFQQGLMDFARCRALVERIMGMME